MFDGDQRTLTYPIPSNGGWGVSRVLMLVPESYQLFVCPFACGRHGALGALQHGYKDRISYLYIDEMDITSGGYEDLIPGGVDELLENLEIRPRALFIFISCIDDLLGTDHEALLSRLRSGHPDIRFGIGHMNPICIGISKTPPAINIQRSMYGLLEKSPVRRKRVNFLGSPVPVDRNSELYEVLGLLGYESFHIAECKNFDDFLQMSESSLNVVIRPPAFIAAQEMKERLGIPFLYAPVSYDPEEIDGYYRQLAEILRPDVVLNLEPYRHEALKKAALARRLIGDKPVAVDSVCTIRPYMLARVLCQLGFLVKKVISPECLALDEAHKAWLEENCSIEYINPMNHKIMNAIGKDSFFLALGFDSGYITASHHVVDLQGDQGLYGFYGLGRIAGMMIDAAEQERDVQQMIKAAALVV